MSVKAFSEIALNHLICSRLFYSSNKKEIVLSQEDITALNNQDYNRLSNLYKIYSDHFINQIDEIKIQRQTILITPTNNPDGKQYFNEFKSFRSAVRKLSPDVIKIYFPSNQ